MAYLSVYDKVVEGFALAHFDHALFAFWAGSPFSTVYSAEFTDAAGFTLAFHRRIRMTNIYVIRDKDDKDHDAGYLFATEQWLGRILVNVATDEGKDYRFVGRLRDWLNDIKKYIEHGPAALPRIEVQKRELTPKEQQVATLLADGMDDNQIAQELTAALTTVTKHRQHIAKKWGVKRDIPTLQREARVRGYIKE